MEVFEQVISSQNILMIVIGAIIWYLGFYIPFIGPFFTVSGFGLICILTVQSAMTRPVNLAFPGLLLGGLIQIIGYYMLFIPLVGWILGPGLIVFGGILIIFYGSSLALQRADIPIVRDMEDFIESKKKKGPSKSMAKGVIDVEENKEENDEDEDISDD